MIKAHFVIGVIRKIIALLTDTRHRLAFRRPQTIRFQLLLAVNLTLGAAFIGLLVLRYEREMNEEVREKQAGLNDEAIAIHAAVSHLSRDHNAQAVQSYIDTVCRRMCEKGAPDHHIVVRLKDETLQAHGHLEATPETLEAAAAGMNSADTAEQLGLVAGSHNADDIGVIVSESLVNIRRATRRDVLTQLVVLAILGLVAAGVVSLVLLRIVSAPLDQLLATVEQIAAGELGVESPECGSREMQQLSAAVNSMSRTLQSSDDERRAQMKKAQRIQQHLLPNGIQIPGLQTGHVFEPADTVAGDYYDFLPLPDGSWLICVADVTGHGVPAAMGAAMLKSLLLAACEQPPFEPQAVLTEINRRFAITVLPGNFASMFLGRWQPESRELSWASAGHEPGVLLTESGRLDQLSSTGLLLGIDPDAEWQQRSVTLAEGDRVLLFSDGATETRSPDGDLFGRELLTARFSQFSSLTPEAALKRIGELLDVHRVEGPQSDDLTLVLLHCGENPESVENLEKTVSEANHAHTTDVSAASASME